MSNNNENIVTLNADQIAHISKELSETRFALATMEADVKSGTLDRDFGNTILGLLEYRIADIAKSTGIQIQTQEQIDKRHAELRQANLRIRALEKQLGESAQVDMITKAIGVMEEKFRYWWDINGFGHTSKFEVHRNGAHITVSGHLFGNYSSFSETPVSDKQARKGWLKSLVDAGYQIEHSDEQRHNEAKLIDCDKNRSLIIDMLAQQFPSSKVFEITNFCSKGSFHIREITLHIQDLSEIERLESRNWV
jgi:hypothetical protein